MNLNTKSKDRFDSEVKSWVNIIPEKDIISWERFMRFEILKKILLNKYKNKKIKILELGCGAGINISKIARIDTNWVCVGVDISPEMINYCKFNHKAKNISFDILNIDKEILKEKFDFIFMLGVVGYIKDNQIVFNNITRMLKNNGEVFFTYGNKHSFFRILRNSFLFILNNKYLLNSYNYFKLKVLKNEVKYDPKKNFFIPYSNKEINSILEDYQILKKYNLCFASGFMGSISVKFSQILEKMFMKKDIFNLSLTKILYIKKR